MATDASGRVVQAWDQAGSARVHAGASAALTSYEYEGGSNCNDTNIATDPSGSLWFASWSSISSTTNGVRVARVDPATGAMLAGPWTLPGSTTNNEYGSHSFAAMSQRTPMTARTSGGIYAAYPTGYPTANVIRLWRLDAAGPSGPRAVTSTSGGEKRTVALTAEATDPYRLWVVWTETSGGRTVLKARRSNASGTAFGATVTRALPSGSQWLAKLSASGGVGRCDVVALIQQSTGWGQYHTQLLPGLTLTRSPTSIRVKRKATVKFRATDAGAPVAGATVTIGGRSAKTNASGYASVAVGPYKTKRTLTARVSKPGYVAAKTTVVRPQVAAKPDNQGTKRAAAHPGPPLCSHRRDIQAIASRATSRRPWRGR